MKGRLVFPSSSLAALVLAAAGMGMVACSAGKQNTDLDTEGPPTIRQVFIESVTGNGLNVDDPAGGTPAVGAIDGNDLAWGLQSNVGECSFDGTCQQTGFTCKTDLFVCVDSSGKQPGVTDAVLWDGGGAGDANGDVPIVQVVFKELLDGTTVESFACGCVATAGGANCVGGKTDSLDPKCGDCPDDSTTTTIDESGTCLDINTDGVADATVLHEGLLTITCGAFTYTNAAGEGRYDPAGNQFVPVDTGFEGIGPRLYFLPPGPFPADSDCELTLATSITDHDKNALVLDSANPITFHTAGLTVVLTAPEKNATMLDPADLAEVDITFNTALKPESVVDGVVTVAHGATNVPGTISQGADDTVVFEPDAEFAAGTTFTVTVHSGTNGVTDTFGKQLAADVTFDFATAAAAKSLKISRISRHK